MRVWPSEEGKRKGKKTIFLERGSIQNNEKLSDNGKEDSSGKGGTRRKKGYQRFSFSLGVRRKRKERQTGKSRKKSGGSKKKTKTKETPINLDRRTHRVGRGTVKSVRVWETMQ